MLTTKIEPFKNGLGFTVHAYIGGEEKGSCWVSLYRIDGTFRATDWVDSSQENSGIPRALIAEASRHIERAATEIGAEIVHRVHFITTRAAQRLPGLYADVGYVTETFRENGHERRALARHYKP